RRRHTRCYRDWSSDVCSSDLGHIGLYWLERTANIRGRGRLQIPRIELAWAADQEQQDAVNIVRFGGAARMLKLGHISQRQTHRRSEERRVGKEERVQVTAIRS